jgi:hypothetical protein
MNDYIEISTRCRHAFAGRSGAQHGVSGGAPEMSGRSGIHTSRDH